MCLFMFRTCWHRLGRDLDRDWMKTFGSAQKVVTAHWRSRTVLMRQIFFQYHTAYHTFSIRFRSGLCGSQKKCGISFLRFQFSVDLWLWLGALSSWKYHWSPTKYVAITGRRFASSTSMYLALYIFPAVNTKGPTPWKIIGLPPQTISLNNVLRTNLDDAWPLTSIFQTLFSTPLCDRKIWSLRSFRR